MICSAEEISSPLGLQMPGDEMKSNSRNACFFGNRGNQIVDVRDAVTGREYVRPLGLKLRKCFELLGTNHCFLLAHASGEVAPSKTGGRIIFDNGSVVKTFDEDQVFEDFSYHKTSEDDIILDLAEIRESLGMVFKKMKKKKYDVVCSMDSHTPREQIEQFRESIRLRAATCSNPPLVTSLIVEEFKSVEEAWVRICEETMETTRLRSPYASCAVKHVFFDAAVDLRGLAFHLKKMGPFPEPNYKGMYCFEELGFNEMMWLAFFLKNACLGDMNGFVEDPDDRYDALAMILLDVIEYEPEIDLAQVLARIHGSRICSFLALAQTANAYLPRLRPDMDVPGVSTVIVQPTVTAPPVAPPEGDVGVTSTGGVNTAIETSVEEPEANFVEAGPSGELADEFEDYPNQPSVLSSRFVEFFNINVTSLNSRGSILAAIPLPENIVRANLKTPNALMFKQYEWFRCGIDLKIQTNCSKFQQFAIMASVIYAADERDSINDLLNLSTLSTMPSVLINGSFSTSNSIDVPFIHVLGMMPTSQNTQTRAMRFATLVLSVVSPLTVAAGTPNSVNVRVFGALKDIKFFGMRGFYDPVVEIPCTPALRGDMLKAIVGKELVHGLAQPLISELKNKTVSMVGSVESILLQKLQDLNRDKPLEMRRGFVIQTTGQDMASGSGKCNATPFRLCPIGTTPHASADVGVDHKFSIDALKQVFGLVAIVPWNAINTSGTLLWQCSVQLGAPIQTGNLLDTKCMAPIDHLGLMFSTYRGSLHYKFVVVTNGLATGKLRVTYEPGVSTTGRCDIDSVPFSTFDIGSDLSSTITFEFVVPYQYMLHQYLLRPTLAPTMESVDILAGNISLFVEIPLVAPASVPPSVEVLIYKCAGENMELGVPRNDISFFNAPIEDDPVNPPGPPGPIEPGPPPPPVEDVVVSRISCNSEQVNRNSPFVLVRFPFVVASPTYNLAPTGSTLRVLCFPDRNWTSVTGSHQANSTRPVEFQFSSLTGSVYRFRVIIGVNILHESQRTIAQNWRYELDGASFGSVALWTALGTTEPTSGLPFNVLRPDGDPRFEHAPKVEKPCPSGRQLMVLANGEKQDSLEDVLRRMELWTNYNVTTSAIFGADNWDINMPASTGAPCYRNQTDVYMRTNRITKIADCFRFFKGGLRFTLVVSSDTPSAIEGTIMEVAHVPFARPDFNRNTQTGGVNVETNGFAVQAFSLKQNNVNTIEIPHYNLGCFNYNSSFLSTSQVTRRMCSLGCVLIRFRGPQQTLQVTVYRALADDARFYVFNGTPERPMASTNKQYYYVAGARPVPVVPTGVEWQRDLTEEGVEPNPGPLLSTLRGDGFLKLVFGKQDASSVHRIIETADKKLPEALTNIQEASEVIKNFGATNANPYIKAADVGTQIMHCVVSPTRATFLLSLSSIILKIHPSLIGGAAQALVGPVLSAAKRIWRSCFSTLHADGFSDEIWHFVCTLGGTKFQRPEGIGQGFGAIARATTAGHRVVAVFKSIFEALYAYSVKMIRKLNPEWLVSAAFGDDELRDVCNSYVEAANVFSSPQNLACIRGDAELSRKVVEAQVYGLSLENGIINNYPRSEFRAYVKAANDKLYKTCQQIITCANRPMVRYEPFVLYLVSNPGVGKSYESEGIIQALLKNLQVPITQNSIYHRAPSSEYWDGYYDGTLAVKYDDFAMSKDEKGMLDLTELVHLKTSAPFVGNFSAIEEKQTNIDPRIVVCCSNVSKPTHVDINDQDAVLRRRDYVAHLQFASSFKFCGPCSAENKNDMAVHGKRKGMGCATCRNINAALIQAEEHVLVQQLNPLTDAVISKKMTLKAFKEHIISVHKGYHEAEKKNVETRVQKMTEAVTASMFNMTDDLRPIVADVAQIRKSCATFDAIFSKYSVEEVNGKKSFVLRPTDARSWLSNPFSKIPISSSMETLRLKKDKAFAKLEDLRDAIMRTGSYDVDAAEKALLGQRIDNDEAPAGPKLKGNGFMINAATQLGGTVAMYGGMLLLARAIKVTRKCSCLTNYEGDCKMSKGWVIVDGKERALECSECMVDRRLAMRMSNVPIFECICSLTMEPRKSFAMGNYLWADDFAFRTFCHECRTSINRNFMNGERARKKFNVELVPEERQQAKEKDQRTFIVWHSIMCAVVVAITLVSTLVFSLCNFGVHGDASPGNKKALSARKNLRKPARLIRGDGFDIIDYVRRHQIDLVVPETRVKVLMIGGRKGLCTFHQLDFLRECGKFSAAMPTGESVALDYDHLKVEQFMTDTGSPVDLATITFPSSVQQFSSIAKHVLSEQEYDDRGVKAAVFDKNSKHGCASGLKLSPVIMTADYISSSTVIEGYQYDVTEAGLTTSAYDGACGSVAIDMQHHKIVGIHVASDNFGFNKKGYVQGFFQETILDQLDDEVQPAFDNDGDCGYNEIFLEGEGVIKLDYDQEINVLNKEGLLGPLKNVVVRGVLPTKLYHLAKTSIVESPMCGVLSDAFKQPVNFRTIDEPLVGVAAMSAAIEKNKPSAFFNGALLEKAYSDIRDDVIAKIIPKTQVQHIRSLDEAINGNENVPFFSAMDMSTSPGFPAKVKHTQKHGLFLKLDSGWFPNHDLLLRHEKNMLMRMNGVKPVTIFACSLKDERLVEGKKPRLIQGAPVEFVLASRRLTMDFACAFYSSAVDSFSAVGMNCMGSDWAKLCSKIRFKNNIMAGDIKAFGPTLDQNVVDRAYQIVNAWYKTNCADAQLAGTCQKARRVLKDEVVNSWNVAYDTVFQTLSCSPTGQPLTVIVNTLCLYMYVYMSWLAVMKRDKGDWANFNKFKEHTDIFAYGDDFIMSVSPEAKKWWNNKILQKQLAEFGIEYTGTDKKSEVPEFETLEQTSFLGRRFVKVESRDAGALDIRVLNDIPNWINKKHLVNPDDIMYSMCVGLLQEFVFHGKEKYEIAKNKLCDFWLAKRKPLIDVDWVTMSDRWKRDEMVDAHPFMLYPQSV